MNKYVISFIAALCCLSFLPAAAQKVMMIDSTHLIADSNVVLGNTSFRGMSVVNDKVAWFSGSHGTIGRTTDGGKKIHFYQLPDYANSDFRDIEAFDANTAVAMSSGSPAVVVRTTDGGKTWKQSFRQDDSSYFLDAIDFWNDKQGAILGDPINGRFLILLTKDGGETWTRLDSNDAPLALPNEAAFAASGSAMTCNKEEKGVLYFVTGGARARFIGSNVMKKSPDWQYMELKIQSGEPSKGAYSIANNEYVYMIVGGDYRCDSCVSKNSAYLTADLFKAKGEVTGYRSCVTLLKNDMFIACGPNGIDLCKDEKWRMISNQGFHVVRKAKKGKAVFLAGSKGRFAFLKW